jgi:hypothetical protein
LNGTTWPKDVARAGLAVCQQAGYAVNRAESDARDGKVLRTNYIPMDRQAMSRYEEAAFVRDR